MSTYWEQHGLHGIPEIYRLHEEGEVLARGMPQQGYWSTRRGTHEYFVDGEEQYNADMSTFVIDMVEEDNHWHAKFWDRPWAPTKSWTHTVSFDLIPAHAIEEARAWAIATWRMTS